MNLLIWSLLFGGVELSIGTRTPTLFYFDIALAVWLVLQLLCNGFIPDFKGWIFRLGTFFLLAGALSALVNVDGVLRSLSALKVYAVGLAVYAIVRRRPVNALVLAGWGAVVAAMILWLYRDAVTSLAAYQALDVWTLDQIKSGLDTVMGRGAYLNSMLLLLLPIALAHTVLHTGWKKVLFITFSTLMLSAVFATLSRGAILSLLLSFIVCVPLIRKLRGGRRYFAATVPVVVVLLWITATGVLAQSVDEIAYRLDNPDEKRLDIARASLAAFVDHPILGVGPGQIGTAIKEQGRAGDNDIHEQYLTSHNLILDAFAENGLLPGLALLTMVGLVIRSAWKKAITNTNPLSVGLFAGVLAALLLDMVEGPFGGEQFQVIFWTVAALIETQPAIQTAKPLACPV